MNWEAKIQKINNILYAWRHRELSFKGRALLINSLVTSTLWYSVTSLAVPSWAITQIEQAIFRFFSNNKHPLVNWEEGGFNIPRLETRIQAFQLNTLRRLLSEEKAHWKHFTSYFLRVSNLHLGKMTLIMDFPLQRINRDIPLFHKELLTAWHRHRLLRTRTRSPESVTDILNEPLFMNFPISTNDKPLFFPDWITAGITRIKDICYEVIPKYLPLTAIHEMLTDKTPCTLSKTTDELRELLHAIPLQWSQQIFKNAPRPPPTLQPCFLISGPGQTHTNFQTRKICQFYSQLLAAHKPVIPALHHWKWTLQPEPLFNAKL